MTTPALMCTGRVFMRMFTIATINRVITTATTVIITAVVTIGMDVTGVNPCHTTTARINGMMGTTTSVGTAAITIDVITMAATAMITTGETITAGTAATIRVATEGTTGVAVITGVPESTVGMIAGAIGMIKLIDWTER